MPPILVRGMRDERSRLSLKRQRVEVWASRLPEVGRRESATEFPDEVHLCVECGLRETCLEDEQDAAVEESARADETEHDGNPTVDCLPDRGDQSDGDARGDEDAEREVEDRHAPLQEARARRQSVELVERRGAALLEHLQALVMLAPHHLLEAVYEKA